MVPTLSDKNCSQGSCVSDNTFILSFRLTDSSFSRARYLRLPAPSTAPRQQPAARPLSFKTTPFPPRAVRVDSTDEEGDDDARFSRPSFRPKGQPATSRPRSEASPVPRYRAQSSRNPSPARSTKSSLGNWYSRERSATQSQSGELEGRTRLWQEFRELGIKGRPSSPGARSREPP
jgi:hypothetical protein